jgi:hypothetical protein
VKSEAIPVSSAASGDAAESYGRDATTPVGRPPAGGSLPPGPSPVTDHSAFVASLTPRGIGLALRRNRLLVRPASAHRRLTDAELAYVREHRASLKKFLIDGQPQAAPPVASNVAPPTAKPQVTPDDYDALGLFVVRGVVTHGLGDDYAQRILRGDITREHAGALARAQVNECAALRRRGAHQ